MDKKVVVCVATRQRPKMLADCLASLARLERPPDYRITVIVVENDDESRCEDIVLAFAQHPDSQVEYVLETRVGIVHARNAAVEAALRIGAALVAFLDDDEQAAEDWLVQLIERQEKTGAALVGGPVSPSLPVDAGRLTMLQRLVFEGVAARYRRHARGALRRQRRGLESSIGISTNNWLCRSDILMSCGLRFDERAGFGSGEDIRFFRAVRDHHGLGTAWAGNAWVAETIPVQRLTLRHQFERSRAFTCDLQLMQSAPHRRRTLARLMIFTTAKVAGIVALTPLVLVKPGDAVVRMVWRLGAIAGAIAAHRKSFSSNLYASIAGR